MLLVTAMLLTLRYPCSKHRNETSKFHSFVTFIIINNIINIVIMIIITIIIIVVIDLSAWIQTLSQTPSDGNTKRVMTHRQVTQVIFGGLLILDDDRSSTCA